MPCTCVESKGQFNKCQLSDCKYNGTVEVNGNSRRHYKNGLLRNPNIEDMNNDILYHLSLASGTHDLVEMFGDVKFVCMGGTQKRMEEFAYQLMNDIGYKLPCGTSLMDICQQTYRYSMHKVGPVLCVSHGMGIPSISILLHELIKLMHHAQVQNPIFFRIGTCGGVGVDGGNVIISEEAVDGALNNYLDMTILGKSIKRPSKLDMELAKELKSMIDPCDPFDIHIGKTMCAYDFYEAQGRLDGAFCEFTEAEKMEYMENIHKAGVVNIEMESLAFAAMTHHAGIKAAVICVALLNRLKEDQVCSPKEILKKWEQRPSKLVSRYIRHHLKIRDQCKQNGNGVSYYSNGHR